MSKYLVTEEWAGYSRGYALYEIEADSEEDARKNYWKGTEIERETIRDDSEGEAEKVELAEEI